MSFPEDAPCPRLCHLIKWPDFNGYGFNLHAEKSKQGQYIGKVDDDSPAHLAGLREGDKIIEVNFVNICNENHRQVVERIKSITNETWLLVIDDYTDRWYREKKMVVKNTQPNVIYYRTPVPRPTEPGAMPIPCSRDSSFLPKRASIKSSTGSIGSRSSITTSNNTSTSETDIAANNQVNAATGTDVEDVVLGSPAQFEVETAPDPSIAVNGTVLPVRSSSISSNSSGKSTATNKTTGTADNSGGQQNNHNHNHHHHHHHQEYNVHGSNSNNNYSGNDSESVGASSSSLSIGAGSMPSSAADSPTPPPPLQQQSPIKNEKTPTTTTNGELNLNMTAAEMRQLIAQRKKKDVKNTNIDLRKKYEIIQQM